jgi:hypothetical protein
MKTSKEDYINLRMSLTPASIMIHLYYEEGGDKMTSGQYWGCINKSQMLNPGELDAFLNWGIGNLDNYYKITYLTDIKTDQTLKIY